MPEATTTKKRSSSSALAKAIEQRRTFAIISHPDAGKTTLTEKLLLYGNAIELAGNVRARRNSRNTTSDWMAMERERGISITSTVLQFPYAGQILNLLDTPGHQDFSEDTYRTLTAVESAVMVLDAAKGVEPQTRRLFEVCSQRGIPIFTFINKMDRPARDRLALLDEIETVLGMQPVPMNWPLGDGPDFHGVVNRASRDVILYERTVRNERQSPERQVSLADLEGERILADGHLGRIQENLELLDALGFHLDPELVAVGKQTPVFFGSALYNFGVRLFLEAFIELAPAPQAYPSESGPVDPSHPEFSGFIFKIQANMDPKHRDSVAFLRIVSGQFERGMSAVHTQSGRAARLQRPYRMFANEREVIEKAFPGDVIGLPNNGAYAIGDTISSDDKLRFRPIPRFQPEHFALLRNQDISKQKHFNKGLRQLETEGAVQVLYDVDALRREPILAVVGKLQFEVVQARLENEYGVETTIERLPYSMARYIVTNNGQEPKPWHGRIMIAQDTERRLVGLFAAKSHAEYLLKQYPGAQLEPFI
ncbi:MAG: peptide chain release factor 3 [Anaerolineales bacterium]